MKYFLTILILSFTLILHAQSDTNHLQLKKGFYRTYEDYVANKPTKYCDFKSTPIFISKADSTLIGLTFKLNDTVLFIRHEWGYCDGTDVYVNISAKNNICTYWKLMQQKPYPFFLSNIEINKGAVLVGFIPVPMTFHDQVGKENIIAPFMSRQPITSLFKKKGSDIDSTSKGINSSLSLRNYLYYIIEEDGKLRILDNDYMKDLLPFYPDLQKHYDEDLKLLEKYSDKESPNYNKKLWKEMVKKTNIEYLQKIHEIQKQFDLTNKDAKE